MLRIRGQGVDRAERMVFRMRTGQQRTIRREKLDPFLIKIFVRDDVERDTLRLEPRKQVQVRRIMPHSGAARIVECEKPRPHRQDRPVAGRKRNAAAIAMLVVGRAAVDRVLVRIVRIRLPFGDAVVVRLIDAGTRVVGIRLVGEGRSQEHDRCERAIAVWQHVERQPVLAGVAGEMQRVSPAGQVVRYGPRKIRLPAAVAQVVCVEMDRAVIVWCVLPGLRVAAPSRADNGARRQVHQNAVAGLGTDVEDRLGIDAQGKVPTGKQFGCQRLQRRSHIAPGSHEAWQDRRIFQLASEMLLRVAGISCSEQNTTGRWQSEPGEAGVCRDRRIAIQRLLPDKDAAARRIRGEPDAIPARRPHRFTGRQFDGPAGRGNPRGRAVGSDHQHGAGIRARFCHQHLAGFAKPGANHDRPGAGSIRIAKRTGSDGAVRSQVDRLPSTGPRLVEAVRQVFEAHSGPVGIRIAAEHAHKSCTIRSTVTHADERGKTLAGAMRETIEVPGDRQFIVGHAGRLTIGTARCQANPAMVAPVP